MSSEILKVSDSDEDLLTVEGSDLDGGILYFSISERGGDSACSGPRVSEIDPAQYDALIMWLLEHRRRT